MSKILRVGNLAATFTETQLEELGAAFGKVAVAQIASSPFSGKSRGFGYIEMKSEEDAAACTAGLQEKECEGKKLTAELVPTEQLKKLKRR